jgi:TonB family protein
MMDARIFSRSRALQCAPPVLSWMVVAACSGTPDSTVRLPENSATRKGEDPPVMVNPQTPVEYPAALFARGIEGKVILRLYTDSSGTVAAESTRVAESSGYPALDSAALAAVPQFRFAPALRDGEPVAGAFLQPVHFRHPQAGGTTP